MNFFEKGYSSRYSHLTFLSSILLSESTGFINLKDLKQDNRGVKVDE